MTTPAQRDALFATLYAELHRIAQQELRRNASATLSPTMLLHETYLSLSANVSAGFADRAKFLGYASRAMRGLLIDYLRNRQAQKRGGRFQITSMSTDMAHAASDDGEMQRLNTAMESLAQVDPRLAECVDLKYFCGFSLADIAAMWGVSERTVGREWDKARMLLRRFMQDREALST